MPEYLIYTKEFTTSVETNSYGEVVGTDHNIFLLGWEIRKLIEWLNKKNGRIVRYAESR